MIGHCTDKELNKQYLVIPTDQWLYGHEMGNERKIRRRNYSEDDDFNGQETTENIATGNHFYGRRRQRPRCSNLWIRYHESRFDRSKRKANTHYYESMGLIQKRRVINKMKAHFIEQLRKRNIKGIFPIHVLNQIQIFPRPKQHRKQQIRKRINVY